MFIMMTNDYYYVSHVIKSINFSKTITMFAYFFNMMIQNNSCLIRAVPLLFSNHGDELSYMEQLNVSFMIVMFIIDYHSIGGIVKSTNVSLNVIDLHLVN